MALAHQLLDGPTGFDFGYAPQTQASWPSTVVKWRPAWIRIESGIAKVIWIESNGDYCGLFRRISPSHVIIKPITGEVV
jgi:hypothetical protein|tara:strand:+ start:414 stop:650 length:237 start_codon:yes stop_codon:yes gene_type:complete